MLSSVSQNESAQHQPSVFLRWSVWDRLWHFLAIRFGRALDPSDRLTQLGQGRPISGVRQLRADELVTLVDQAAP